MNHTRLENPAKESVDVGRSAERVAGRWNSVSAPFVTETSNAVSTSGL